MSKEEEEKCAPTKSYNEGSCFTINQLKIMSESYNNFIDENKIKGDKINIDDNDKRGLIRQLTNRLENRQHTIHAGRKTYDADR